MDAYEATKVVFQRIQNMDPQNASKIMGFLLIQDHGEKEMIRLAFGPESLLHSVILSTKKDLNLPLPNTPSSTNTTTTTNSNNLFSLSRQNSSSRIPSPLSITNNHSFSRTGFSDDLVGFSDDLVSPGAGFGNGGEVDLIDELYLQDQLSFLDDGSPQLGPAKSPDFFHQELAASSPADWGGSAGLHHRRSCSVSDISLGLDDPSAGFGWKPCLFYARGYCKNGTACRFHHGETLADGGGQAVGSPSKLEMLEQLMAMNNGYPLSPSVGAANKGLSFLPFSPDSPRFDRRGDFGINGLNPGARQIYLTFPADSAFKEEDVSNYFSNFGPVQDVRIPYQQKRMFGFVTFDFPDTVKLILAKGNPHFVCDARVLVKPYKEKGKIPDKHRKQQQQMERGDFIGCGSPTGLDSRDPYDFQLGATRMFYNNTQDMLQQAIELQNRRLMGLQLLDVKRNNNSHHRTLSTGAVISSPTAFSPTFFSQNSSNRSSPDFQEENGSIAPMANEAQRPTVNGVEKDKDYSFKDDQNINGKDSPTNESGLHESLDHNLPDSPFASPKASRNYATAFPPNGTYEAEKGIYVTPTNNNLITGPPFNSSLDMSPFTSCYFHLPRFASGHEAIGM